MNRTDETCDLCTMRKALDRERARAEKAEAERDHLLRSVNEHTENCFAERDALKADNLRLVNDLEAEGGNVAWFRAEMAAARRLLFLAHGCSGKYGDDGEMQCNRNPAIDFGRMTMDEIEQRSIQHGLARVGASAESEDDGRGKPCRPDQACDEGTTCRATATIER